MTVSVRTAWRAVNALPQSFTSQGPTTLSSRLRHAVHESRRTHALHVLVLGLLPVPFLLLAHQLYKWGVPLFGSNRWGVNQDRSYIEFLGYLQLTAAAVLLLLVGLRAHGRPVLLAWAGTLAAVVLDDALEWHETGGAALVERGLVPDLPGVPVQALGELAAWGLMGVPVVLVLALAHSASTSPARAASWALGGLTGLLMVFGVGVDLAHDIVEEITDNTVVDVFMIMLEAGGELVGMTTILAFVVHLGGPGVRTG